MQFSSWLRQLVGPQAEPRSRRSRKARRSLLMEHLEDRRLLSVLRVNSLMDNTNPGDDQVTLREALLASTNQTATDLGDIGTGSDIITFTSDLAGTIDLSIVGDTSIGSSALVVNSQITIDGNNGGAGITISRDNTVSNLRLFDVTR